jgi:beta-phosphoglucomutase-like phosphatase (HAD superfamily)
LAHLSTKEMEKQVVMIAKEKFKEEIQFIHGFLDFQKKITDAGIPISIATNCDAVSLESLVKKMEFDKHFGEHIYCVAHVEKPKPHPDLFLLAADKIGADPEKCVVFEDSLWGFKAADAANMKCIAIKNKKNANFFADHTHGHIESYHDAEQVIEDIVRKHFAQQEK